VNRTHTNATDGRTAGPERALAELLDVKAVAALLDCSSRHVYRLADAGRMPRPLKLGALVRWRRAELQQWVTDGCRPVRSVRGAAT
jgi:excisionase family DNA binding protein